MAPRLAPVITQMAACTRGGRLAEVGYQVGVRMLELQSFREKKAKRELEIVGILGFISVNVWRALFGERADSLERSTEHDEECIAPFSFSGLCLTVHT